MDTNIRQFTSNRQPYVEENPSNITPPHPLDEKMNLAGIQLDGDSAKSIKADYDAIDRRLRESRAFQRGMSLEQYDVAQKAYCAYGKHTIQSLKII